MYSSTSGSSIVSSELPRILPSLLALKDSEWSAHVKPHSVVVYGILSKWADDLPICLGLPECGRSPWLSMNPTTSDLLGQPFRVGEMPFVCARTNICLFLCAPSPEGLHAFHAFVPGQRLGFPASCIGGSVCRRWQEAPVWASHS